MNRRVVVVACVGTALSMMGACKSKKTEEGEKAGTSMVTSSELRQSIDDASERIAKARCEKEVNCSPHHNPDWSDEANKTACHDRVKAESTRELTNDACPHGINQDRLIRCVAAIEQTGCDDPVGRLMTLEDCKKAKLCMSTTAP